MAPHHHSRSLVIVGLIVVLTITIYQFNPRSYRSALPKWSINLPGNAPNLNTTSSSIMQGDKPSSSLKAPPPNVKPEVAAGGAASHDNGLQRVKGIAQSGADTATLIENDPEMKAKFGKWGASASNSQTETVASGSKGQESQNDKVNSDLSKGDQMEESTKISGTTTTTSEASPVPTASESPKKPGNVTEDANSTSPNAPKKPVQSVGGQNQQDVENTTNTVDKTAHKPPKLSEPSSIIEDGVQEVESIAGESKSDDADYKKAHMGLLDKEPKEGTADTQGQSDKTNTLKSDEFDYEKAHDGIEEEDFAEAVGHRQKPSGTDVYKSFFKSNLGPGGADEGTDGDEDEHIELKRGKAKGW